MKEVRRILIFCASPKQITEAKKYYNPTLEDENHCLFNYKDVISWIDVSKILGKFLDLAILDLEMEKGKGESLFSKIKKEFPDAGVLGIRPSQKNKP